MRLPGRGLPVVPAVSLLSPCGLPVASLWPSCGDLPALWRLMPWHCSASCWCYVALVACPALAVLGASIKQAYSFQASVKLAYLLVFDLALWLELEADLEFD